jgi:hypothetical protein
VCYICRTREKLGVVRVSTAYQFFQAVEEHLVFKQQNYYKSAKPPFEATCYKLYYYAADEADRVGKERSSYTLNRNNKWNCTVLKGSSAAYEFVGLALSPNGAHLIAMRFLPCPCAVCFNGEYHLCELSPIVGDMEADVMKPKEAADCPDRLGVPLTKYTNAVLEAFIKLYKDKLPKKKTKTALIQYISTDPQLALLIDFDDNDDYV